MKKFLTIILVIIMTFALFSCKPKDKLDDASTGDASVEKDSDSDKSDAKSEATDDDIKSEKMELNVLNWGDYIDPEVLEEFRNRYPNIDVMYDTTASNEEMLALLQSGGAVYDICFPSDYIIARMIKEDMLLPIDSSKISNYANIDETFLDFEFDPGSAYSVPYHWGTVGILYNQSYVNEEVDNWSVLWDQKYKKQIFMYDSVRDSMGVALKRLGYSLNSTDPEQIKQAEESLILQKSLVQAYGIDNLRDKMIGGAGSFAVVYSGDAIAAIEENDQLAYAVPKEGSNIWFDNIVILKDSENVEAAYLFIDFLQEAEIAAKNASYIGYSTPNKAALELLPGELVSNEIFNPPADVVERCEAFIDLGDAIKLYNEAWINVKAS